VKPRVFLPLIIAIFCAVAPSLGLAQSNIQTQATNLEIKPQELAAEIAGKLDKVTEFRFVRDQAAKMGVRVYLFGGTAAGFAHYVKWDLQRQKGDPRFQPDRFDYDYTNIYRSTQDLDIVVDGTLAQAEQFQQILRNKYPHLQGSKPRWEVRCLRFAKGKPSDPGYKEALLNDPDFLNQHTDSNSVGMIEVSPPQNGEPFVRDLRDWNSNEPTFLEDVAEGSIHYYFSLSHDLTGRFKAGKNPSIFSVVRLLTKAFQYELKLKSEQWALIERVVDEFNPERDLANPQARDWLERNAPKLIQHAVNIEYAADILDKLGLRKKLVSLGSISKIDSMAWWLNREPLKSHEFGTGPGRTGAEIAQKLRRKQIIVAHETAANMLAYESITRAHTGDPNVLISRQNTPGENAYYGAGFYTKLGLEGARQTGWTIRFTVDPRAREGEDFTIHGDAWLFHNKRALRVIPESLHMTALEYFQMLFERESFDESDRALIEKQKRRIKTTLTDVPPKDLKKIRAMVLADLERKDPSVELFKTWIYLNEQQGTSALNLAWDEEIVLSAIQNNTLESFAWLQILKNPNWLKAYKKLHLEIRSLWAFAFNLIEKLNPELSPNQRLEVSQEFEAALKDNDDLHLHYRKAWEFALNLLNRPDIKRHPELLTGFIEYTRAHVKDSIFYLPIARWVGGNPLWADFHDQIFPTLIEYLSHEPNKQCIGIFASEAFKEKPERDLKWIEYLIDRGLDDPSLSVVGSLASVMAKPGIPDRLFDKWLDAILKLRSPSSYLEPLFMDVIPVAPRFRDEDYLRGFLKKYYALPENLRDEYSVINNSMPRNKLNLENDVFLKALMDAAIEAHALQSLEYIARLFETSYMNGREELLKYFSRKAFAAKLGNKIEMHTSSHSHLPLVSEITPRWITDSQWFALKSGRIHPSAYLAARLMEESFDFFSHEQQKEIIQFLIEKCFQEGSFKELLTPTKVVFSRPNLGWHEKIFSEYLRAVELGTQGNSSSHVTSPDKIEIFKLITGNNSAFSPEQIRLFGKLGFTGLQVKAESNCTSDMESF